MGIERPAKYYDEIYRSPDSLYRDETTAPWRPLWKWVGERVLKTDRVLDLGCGPASLIEFLPEGASYLGIDFSHAAINTARAREAPALIMKLPGDLARVCTEYRPTVVTACEFLEHIEDDIGCLEAIPRSTLVIMTLPKFDYESHVRHFPTLDSAHTRYDKLLDLGETEEFEHHWAMQGLRGS